VPVLLWILVILLLLLLLLCLSRVGVTLHLEEQLTLTIRAGVLRFHLDPFAEKPPKEEKKPKKEKNQKKGTEAKKMPKPTLDDLKDAWETLWPVVKKTLARIGRGLRIDPLEVSVTLGGEDPASLAQLYGWLSSALWTAMPVLERTIDIPDPGIWLGVDFQKQKTEVRGRIGLSFRIGTLLRIALGAGIPALRWFLKFRKKHRETPPPAQKSEEKQAA